jgi:hypothetical protein
MMKITSIWKRITFHAISLQKGSAKKDGLNYTLQSRTEQHHMQDMPLIVSNDTTATGQN